MVITTPPGSIQISCQALSDPGILLVANNPTGAGGKALNLNFTTLQYRQPKCSYSQTSGRPTRCDDAIEDFGVGSRWLETQAGVFDEHLDKMWVCVDHSEGAAIWVPFLRWQYPAQWQADDPQHVVLLVDNHFGVDGEIRRVNSSAPAAGAPLVLVPQHTELAGGAILLGTHEQTAGGQERGASAIDLQNLRQDDHQVALGQRSFIAGGAYNMAGGDFAHCEGHHSQVVGPASRGAHAEGYADLGSIKSAGAVGAHVEGCVTGSGGRILASAEGAHAEGCADAGAQLHAAAPGAHAEGYVHGSERTVAGGRGAHAEGGGTCALGDFSHAGGRCSQATLATQTAHASGMFREPGDAQVTRLQMLAETHDATPRELTIDGHPPGANNRYRLAAGRSYAMTLSVHARDSQSQVYAVFKRTFVIRDANGTAELLGTPQPTDVNLSPQKLDLEIATDRIDRSLQVVVRGLAERTIRWLADVEALELGSFADAAPSVIEARRLLDQPHV